MQHEGMKSGIYKDFRALKLIHEQYGNVTTISENGYD
jgi:hypothetical protein